MRRRDGALRLRAVGLITLALAWFTTVAMGRSGVRRSRQTPHEESIIRSNVVAFACVVFRLVDNDLFPVPADDPQRLSHPTQDSTTAATS